MALLKNKLKVNKVSLDFENYYFFLKGVEKSGKTTLARDLILKLYGTPEAGILMAIGKEKGYKALDNIQALDVEDWYAQVIQGNNSNYIDKQDKLFI